jgi:hypothetical protein
MNASFESTCCFHHNTFQAKFITLTTTIMPKKETKAPQAGKDTKVTQHAHASKDMAKKHDKPPAEKPQAKKYVT